MTKCLKKPTLSFCIPVVGAVRRSSSLNDSYRRRISTLEQLPTGTAGETARKNHMKKTKSTKAPKTHITTRNDGRTVEISDADYKRLEKTGETSVTDLRAGEVLTAKVTHWRV